jgi:hypothetical protein
LIKRIGTDSDSDVTVVRGVLHGAMALYLTRYLNVPPARIPDEGGEQLDDLPTDSEAIRAALLDAFDRQRQVDLAARLVARHFNLGHPAERLMATLALAVLREDAGFHAYQMLEAGVRQFVVWGDTDEGRHILIAVARYLAAHSPIQRPKINSTHGSSNHCVAATQSPPFGSFAVSAMRPAGSDHGLGASSPLLRALNKCSARHARLRSVSHRRLQKPLAKNSLRGRREVADVEGL